jgi:ribose transport system ATP-binding protein
MTNNEHQQYVLELDHITKIFPGVRALDDVSLKLKPGEVLALVGENGAGKSTLINCITGVFSPEEGDIRVNGQTVHIRNPQVSAQLGISVVHQERNLISTFDVAENIFFDRISGKGMRPVNRVQMHKDAAPLLKRVRLDIDPESGIEDLSSAQKQLIEIARALSGDAKILLLDEPTASISIREADMLLEIVGDLRKQGVSIIYVSHKLDEIFAIADRVKVIRDGRDVGDERPIGELTRDSMIEMMVGSRQMKQAFPSKNQPDASNVLEANGIASKHSPQPTSFTLKKGEILGWYGLVGSGRTELARELIGIDPVRRGQLKVNGKEVRIKSYKEAFEKHGIYYMSENRKEEGLFLMHSIATNISVVSLKQIKNKANFNSFRKEREMAEKMGKKLQIKMKSSADVASSLSGGNQQKVCVAKCLITDPDIIIADEPTVGIDVKTKAEIHKLLYELAGQGKSIIMISSDLPELIQIAERILIFSDFKVVGELENMKDYDVMSTRVMESILKN